MPGKISPGYAPCRFRKKGDPQVRFADRDCSFVYRADLSQVLPLVIRQELRPNVTRRKHARLAGSKGIG
jgi:hypothetical protein